MGMQGKLKTVSGPIVTVNDALARNAKSLVVNFAPVQAAGTPSPDNILPISGWTGVTGCRTGVNLFDPSNLKLLVINDSQSTGYGHSFTKAATYSIHAYGTGDTSYLYCRVKYADGTFGNVIYIVGSTTVTYDTVVTLSEGQTLLVYNAQNQTAEVSTQKFIDWQVQVAIANTKPDVFTPYTGTTYPVTFPAVGKNLFDNVFYATNDAYITSGNYGYKYTGYIQLAPNTKYVIKPNSSGTLTKLDNYVILGAGSAKYVVNNYQYGLATTFTTGADGMIRFGVHVPSGATRPEGLEEMFAAMQIQLEKGSTPTAYEPYTNTIYGGYVDLVSGVLVRTYGYWTLDGSQNDIIYKYEEGTNGDENWLNVRVVPHTPIVIGADSSRSTSSFLPYVYANITTSPHYYLSNNANIFVPKSDFPTVDSFKAWLANNPQIIVYRRSSPIVVATLTPQTIAMLRGTNNVWSNANGNVELTYYAQ